MLRDILIAPRNVQGIIGTRNLIWIIYMPDLNLKDYIIFPPPEWRIDIQPCCKKTKFACCSFLQMLCRLPKFPGFCYLGGISMEMSLLIKAVQNDWVPPNLSFWETTRGRDNSSEDMRFFDFREDSRPRQSRANQSNKKSTKDKSPHSTWLEKSLEKLFKSRISYSLLGKSKQTSKRQWLSTSLSKERHNQVMREESIGHSGGPLRTSFKACMKNWKQNMAEASPRTSVYRGK